MMCIQNGLSEFYKNLLVAWSEFKYRGLVDVTEIKEKILWKNSHIRFKNSTLLFSKWYVAGISRVKHVITNGIWKDSIMLNSKVGIHQLLFEFEYAKLKKCFPCFWLNKLYVLKNVVLISKQNDSNLIR